MENFIYILLALIYLCSAYEVIPISDYETKYINFNSIQNYYIFKYNYIKIRKFGRASFVLEISGNEIFFYYIYKSLNQIQIDENDHFRNYLDYGNFTYQQIYNGSNFIKNDTEEYYIIIEQRYGKYLDTKFTIYPYKLKFDIYTIIGAFILGIGLSIPNIILQIVRKCKNQMTSTGSTFL